MAGVACTDQDHGAERLADLTDADHRAPVVMVRDVPDDEGAGDHRDEHDQTDQPEMECAIGELIDLPLNGYRDDLVAGSRKNPGPPVERELFMTQERNLGGSGLGGLSRHAGANRVMGR